MDLLDLSLTLVERMDSLEVPCTRMLAPRAEKAGSEQSALWGNAGGVVIRALVLGDELMSQSSPWWTPDHYQMCLLWEKVANSC